MKTKRGIITLCLAVAAIYASMAETVGAGMTMLGASATDQALTMRCHVRASMKDKGSWGLVWGCTSPDDYLAATLTFTGGNDEIYTPETVVTVRRVRGGETECLSTQRLTNGIDTHGGYNSLKLVYDGVSARLYAGASEAIQVGVVPFAPGEVCIVSDKPVECSRHDCHVEEPEPVTQSLVTPAELGAYLAASEDMNEAVWEYLDRDIDDSMSVLGGRYTVATVRNAAGGYDIVYLGGASVEKDRWPRGRVKGRLSPTIFRGSYDLSWLDSRGVALTDDMDATISDDHSILTLRFPALRAQIRFRRGK